MNKKRLFKTLINKPKTYPSQASIIKKLEIDSTYNSNMDRNKLKLNLEFFINNNPTMLDSIEIVIE